MLRRLNYHLGPSILRPAIEPFDPARLREAEDALRRLPVADAASRAYLEKHVLRLARTIALAPGPQSCGRALELGCYMQVTPLLQRILGYSEVRGAYYGDSPGTTRETVSFPDGDFTCLVDHFDAERAPFPYPDEHFDLVIAGEIIEHLIHDPMHLLLEARRVLSEGGFLLVTTPNIASITSVAKTLEARDNPQIYFYYPRPLPGRKTSIGHFREYTLHELGAAVKAAGFEVQHLFTTFNAECSGFLPLLKFLEDNGYDPENRGEQSWCLAVKRAALPVDRYPSFLYDG